MKISVCVPFYPWYYDFDRTEELFRVMIPSMRAAGPENFELSICDAGIVDKYGNRAETRSVGALAARLRKEWPGELVYTCTDRAFTPPHHEYPSRVWISAAVNMSVYQSNHPFLFLNNIDIEIPKNFVQGYFANVKDGSPWFPKCYNIRGDMPRVHEDGGWRHGTGLVGITRSDYLRVGGNDETYIKNRHDSDLFNRCSAMFAEPGALERNRPLLNGLFHIDHPGTSERTSAFNERGWK